MCHVGARAGAFAEGVTPTFRQIALSDAFLEAGALPTLHDMYGLSTEKVVERIKAWL